MEILDNTESFLHWDRNLSELSECGEHDVLYSTHFSELLDDLSQDALLGQLLSDPFLSGGGGRGGGGRGGGARGGVEAMEEEEEGEEEESALPPHITAEHSYSLCGDSRPQSPLSHLNAESPLSHLNAEQGSDAGESELSDVTDWTMEEQEEESMETLLCESPSLLLPTLSLSLDPPPAPAAGPPTPTTPDAVDPLQAPPPQTPSSHNQAKSIKIKQEVVPQIKLEPHEVDQFLNLSPKGVEVLRMPPTPPSSHGSDSEGSQSPSPHHGGHAPPEPPLSCPASPRSPGPASSSSSSTAAAPPSGLKGAAPPPRATSSSSSSSSLSNSPLLTAPHKLQGSGPLLLTEEERRTLVAEGYPVPTKLPLTKAEEKALKKIRRKIKNKISAQESRRKKKEYMDALEKKVETCSNENSELRRKVENLECTNKSLLQQLQSLQAVVAGKVPRSCRVAGTQTSSCLMVVVLCFAVFVGHFYPSSLMPCSTITETGVSSNLQPAVKEYTTTVKSRNLLSAFEDEQPHLLGLGGDYPDQWEDTPAVVMAAWRRSEQQKQLVPEAEPGAVGAEMPLPPAPPFRLVEAEPSMVEMPLPPAPPFRSNNNNNETQQSNNILLELHRVDQRLNDSSSKVLHLDRTVNETS